MVSNSLFYITVGRNEDAERIAKVLVKEKLVACVNLIPRVKSFFYWGGEVQSEEEVILLGKTKNTLMDELVETVKKYHPYDLPCIISFSIEGGNPPFLDWINTETK